jgi:hypothetical protein
MLGSGLRSPFSWADKQTDPQRQIDLMSANQIGKALTMEFSVVTARCGSVLWRGKKESRDYEEYLAVKMPLYLILCSRSLVILKVHVWRIGLEVLSPIIDIVHKSISTDKSLFVM